MGDELLKKNMAEDGLNEISLMELAEKGELERSVISKFGYYLNQSPETILRTKIYDIQHNKQVKSDIMRFEEKNKEEQKKDGICFWTIQGLNEKHTRKFLSQDGKFQGSRYLILPYTKSNSYKNNKNLVEKEQDMIWQELNPQSGENIEDFFKRMKGIAAEKNRISETIFASGYKLNKEDVKQNRVEIYPYPEKMFPEVLSKSRKNVAFLVSQLSYAKENFQMKELYKFFYSYPKKGKNELYNSMKRASHICVGLKNKEIFQKEFKYQNDGDIAGCLIAKLAYPYIVVMDI